MPKKPVNLFANVKSDDKIITPTTKAKKEKTQVELGSALDEIASIDALRKFLDAKREIIERQVKDRIKTQFIEMSLVKGGQPENFTGVSEFATASCEMKKRSSASVLSEAEVEILNGFGIPVKREVTFSVPERIYFNEEVLSMGEDVLLKISKALSAIPELRGVDIIKKQEAQEIVKNIVDEATLPSVCTINDAEQMGQLLDIAATFSIKPKLKPDHGIIDAYSRLRAVLEAGSETASITEM